MALRPVALSLLLGFASAALAFLIAANLFLCAAAVLPLADALSARVFGALSSVPSLAAFEAPDHDAGVAIGSE
jgi:hypothetical protein